VEVFAGVDLGCLSFDDALSLFWLQAYMVTLFKIHYMLGNPMEGISNIYKSPILV
jgi:hypothetical protein